MANLTSGLEGLLSDLSEVGIDLIPRPLLDLGDEHLELDALREGIAIRRQRRNQRRLT